MPKKLSKHEQEKKQQILEMMAFSPSVARRELDRLPKYSDTRLDRRLGMSNDEWKALGKESMDYFMGQGFPSDERRKNALDYFSDFERSRPDVYEMNPGFMDKASGKTGDVFYGLLDALMGDNDG